MRVNYVQKARASTKDRRCHRCGAEINVGDPYKWLKSRYGPKLNFCNLHSPKRSEMTNSKMGALYDAIDEADPSTVTTAEDASELLREVAQIAEETAADYQDGLDAMPEGLQYGSVGEEIQEKIDICQSFAQEIEYWDFTERDEHASEDEYIDYLRDEVTNALSGFEG